MNTTDIITFLQEARYTPSRVERRSRKAKAAAWQSLKLTSRTFKNHPWDFVKFDYRVKPQERFKLRGNTVVVDNLRCRPLPACLVTYLAAKRARQHELAVPERHSNSLRYNLAITRDGDVRVGCKYFTFEELDDFFAPLARKRTAKKKV